MQSNDETPDSSDTEADTSKSQENKFQSMTKAETFMLLDLIAKSQILHCKSKKLAAHELKNQEWERIAQCYNSGSKSPRSVKQLRLKWNNLKKFAKSPANRAKPCHYDVIVRVLDIINYPKSFDVSQVNNTTMINTDNSNETELFLSDDSNLDKSQNNDVAKNLKRNAKVMNRPMTNSETTLLVDLIARSQVLNCKSGKAAANELKHQEWQRICKLFNSRTNTERTPKQLTVKWENLKKFSRQQANKAKQNKTQLNDIVSRVLNIINNPKPFNVNQINVENYDSPEIDFWCTNNKKLEFNNTKDRETAKSMNKHESNTLLDLIESSPIINSSESFSNKVKRTEWCRICNEFNKSKGITEAKTPKQLCLRWEYLKKAAYRQTFSFRRYEMVDRVRAILKNINQSIERNESEDDDDIHSAVYNYVDTTFSDTEEAESKVSDMTATPLNCIVDKSFNNTEDIKPRISEITEIPTNSIVHNSFNDAEDNKSKTSDITEIPTITIAKTSDKVKAMSKEEINVLLDLIDKSRILHNKVRNPFTNEIKINEWERISNEFRTIVGANYYTADQLRTKWKNLKANARKRTVEVNNKYKKTRLETSDIILDKVSSILDKFEKNEINNFITVEVDPLDITNEEIKVKSEPGVDEDNSEVYKQVKFTRRETKILVTLVRCNKVICNRRTTPNSNEAKQKEWRNIAKRFNAIALPEVPRSTRQLFLQWQHLKRQARKMNLQIRNVNHDKMLPNASSNADDKTQTTTIARNIMQSKTPELVKVKPMTDKEIKTFVDLIEKSKIIGSNEKYSFRVKLIEWQRISKLFNLSTHIHRTWRQLRFKWDNLKKKARILMSEEAEDNDYTLPRNETLDRVVKILQERDKRKYDNIGPNTFTQLNTDNTPKLSLKIEHLTAFLDIIEGELHVNNVTVEDLSQLSPKWYLIVEKFYSLMGVWISGGQMHADWNLLNECLTNVDKNRQMSTQIPKEFLSRVSTMLHKYSKVNNNANNEVTTEAPQNIIIKTEIKLEPNEDSSPDSDHSMEDIQDFTDYQEAEKSSTYKESRLSRNTAIAEYFVVKKKIAEAKLNRILLENEKLKLEIDLLKSREK